MNAGRIVLPGNVRPDAYVIHLTVDFEEMRYTGVVDVELDVQRDSKEVTFHALDFQLDYDQITLKSDDGVSYSLTSHSRNEKEETTTLVFDRCFAEGTKLHLHMTFSNTLKESLNGFYRSKYISNGKERWIAITQFEPVDARRAFPCWDEPALKATFEVILTVPRDLTALSNMPVLSTTPADDPRMNTVRFQTTPRMSVYLVAFAVGEFEYIEGVTKNNVPMRIYTRPNYAQKCAFALDVGMRVLDFFTSVFKVPYPLPKLDMISVPDLAAGAMENWGLITYREAALICDSSSSMYVEQNVASIVAHEEAHQWFGNICTLQWWSELWLNEGFATWAAAYVCDILFPHWDFWTQFCKMYLFGALALDSLRFSHPIEVEVTNSRDIDEIFDSISYDKGGSVIRMLVDYMGESTFMEGIHNYLVEYSYGNARTTDLWEQLSRVSGLDIGGLMSTWTTKVGYPVVSVSFDDGHLALSQQRFLLSGTDGAGEGDDTIWQINLAIQTDRSPDIQHIKFAEKSILVPFDGGFSWLNANANQVGVFRVKYSSALLRMLFPAVKAQQISAKDRLGLVSNTVALSKAGHVPLPEVLELLESYYDETEYPVWSEISTDLSAIWVIWTGQRTAPLLTKFQAKLFSRITERLGWDEQPGESDSSKLLRPLVLMWSHNSGDKSIFRHAAELFERYLVDPTCMKEEVRDAVFIIVASSGGEAELERFMEIYRNADEPNLKMATLKAICRVPNLTRRVYLWALESGDVRAQDIHIVTRECTMARDGKQIVWELVQEKWDLIVNLLKGQFLLSSVVGSATGGLISERMANEVEEFFKIHRADGISRVVQQSLEKIRINTAWLQRECVATESWLNEHYHQPAPSK